MAAARLLALSRAPVCALARASADDRGDYVDLLITRFSLAFGRRAKIAFTARGA